MARPKRPRDPNQLAKLIVDIATGQSQDKDPNAGKNPAAVELGKLGGKKGGKARAKKLPAKRRKAIAKKAAAVRWAKR
jgi:hypothetical protein